MAKSAWTREKYRNALKGIAGSGVPGLRSTVKGFNPADGYNLSEFDTWSSSKKRRVRDYHDRVHGLLAQERKVIRPRDPATLRKLHTAFHGDVPSGAFKVAFMPYTEPMRLPGAKPAAVKWRVNAKGGITIDAGTFQRLYEPLNPRQLATQTDKEIKRALAAMPEARWYFVQAGQFMTLRGRSAKGLAEQVKEYMHKYNGKRPLPRGSGNYGDSPAAHDYRLWLNGVVGYRFPKTVSISQMQTAIVEGIRGAKLSRKVNDMTESMTDAEIVQFHSIRQQLQARGMRDEKAIGKASAKVKARRTRKG